MLHKHGGTNVRSRSQGRKTLILHKIRHNKTTLEK